MDNVGAYQQQYYKLEHLILLFLPFLAFKITLDFDNNPSNT